MSIHNNRDARIDFLKGFGIISVVIGHSTAIYAGNWENPFKVENLFFNAIGNLVVTFHMPLFILISAYLSTGKKKVTNIKQFIYKRFKRLIIPYLFFGIIYLLVFSRELSYFDILLKLFQGDVGHLWFLYALFFIQILSPIFGQNINWKDQKSKIVLTITILLGFYFLSYVIGKYTYYSFAIHRVSKFMIFYYFGLCLYYNNEEILRLLNKYFVFILILFTTVFIFKFSIYNLDIIAISQSLKNIAYPIFYFVLAVSSLSIIILSIYNFKIGKQPLLLKVGAFSMGIYLFHQFIIKFIIEFFSTINYHNSILFVCIALVVSVLASIILMLLFRKIKLEFLLGE